MSVDGWMDKQNVVHAYNGILVSPRVEGNSEKWYTMDEMKRRNAKWINSVTKRQILYDPVYMRYIE